MCLNLRKLSIRLLTFRASWGRSNPRVIATCGSSISLGWGGCLSAKCMNIFRLPPIAIIGKLRSVIPSTIICSKVCPGVWLIYQQFARWQGSNWHKSQKEVPNRRLQWSHRLRLWKFHKTAQYSQVYHNEQVALAALRRLLFSEKYQGLRVDHGCFAIKFGDWRTVGWCIVRGWSSRSLQAEAKSSPWCGLAAYWECIHNYAAYRVTGKRICKANFGRFQEHLYTSNEIVWKWVLSRIDAW